jgi:hypothetical protein
MPLKLLNISANRQVRDLSPLRGMQMEVLEAAYTDVSDLSPLRGMPLKHLTLGSCPVVDLRPLQGMPLEVIDIGGTRVRDVTSLKGMKIQHIHLSAPYQPIKGLEHLRSMKSLQNIIARPAAEFWRMLDAGEIK